ncbi:MAG: protein kinase [Myxococcota bacterium]
MEREAGICPSCRDEGEVGAPCPERGCRARGYHFIPRAYATHPRLDAEVGLLLEARYLLAGCLGEGGFGKVFVALDLKFETKVALKLLKTGPDPEAHEKRTRLFELEAKVLARLSHPNIVQLKGFGLFEGEPYIVLEYIEGGRTLAREVTQRAKEGRDMSLAEVEAILSGVLFGLEEAHQLQIVHRDIKPENVMLQAKPGHPVLPRILDFGIAKLADATAQSSAITGTPDYMAPEQVSRGEIGPWTDLYALGVMAFELMLGRRPFSGDLVAILSAKCDRDFDPLAAVADLDVRPPIKAFIRNALAFDPRDRYRSAPEFRKAMQAAFAAAEGAGRRSVSVSDLVTADRLPLRPGVPQRRTTPPPSRRWVLPLAIVAAAAVGAGVVFVATRPDAAVPGAGPGPGLGAGAGPGLGAPTATTADAQLAQREPSAPDAAPADPPTRPAPVEADTAVAETMVEEVAPPPSRCPEDCAVALASAHGLAPFCAALCRDPGAAPSDAAGLTKAAEALLRAAPVEVSLGGDARVAAHWTAVGGDDAEPALTLDAPADLGAFAVWDKNGRNVVLTKGARILSCEARPLFAWAVAEGPEAALHACLRVRADEAGSGEWLKRSLAMAEAGGPIVVVDINVDAKASFVKAGP